MTENPLILVAAANLLHLFLLLLLHIRSLFYAHLRKRVSTAKNIHFTPSDLTI